MEKFGVGGANKIPRFELRTMCDDAVNQPRWEPAENNYAAPGAAGHDLPGAYLCSRDCGQVSEERWVYRLEHRRNKT